MYIFAKTAHLFLMPMSTIQKQSCFYEYPTQICKSSPGSLHVGVKLNISVQKCDKMVMKVEQGIQMPVHSPSF